MSRLRKEYGQAGEYLTFEGGMICWFFWVDTAQYRVNSQQYYEDLPRPEILGILYRHEKKRLTEWLEKREKERQEAWMLKEQLKREAREPRPPGRPPRVFTPEALERRRETSRRYHAIHRPKKSQLPRLPNLIKHPLEPWLRPNGEKYYAAFPLSDHDWIEAMFWLYGQQRSRLL